VILLNLSQDVVRCWAQPGSGVRMKGTRHNGDIFV
jgi:hypothetical protein